MIRTVNDVLPGVKRPFRVEDIQFLWEGLNNVLASSVGSTPRVLSGFTIKEDSNLSAGVIAFNGKLYMHPDTDGYRIAVNSSVYAGQTPSEDDMRAFADGTVQNMYFYDVLSTNSAIGQLVGVFSKDNIEDWSAFGGGSAGVSVFNAPLYDYLIYGTPTVVTLSTELLAEILLSLQTGKDTIIVDSTKSPAMLMRLDYGRWISGSLYMWTLHGFVAGIDTGRLKMRGLTVDMSSGVVNPRSNLLESINSYIQDNKNNIADENNRMFNFVGNLRVKDNTVMTAVGNGVSYDIGASELGYNQPFNFLNRLTIKRLPVLVASGNGSSYDINLGGSTLQNPFNFVQPLTVGGDLVATKQVRYENIPFARLLEAGTPAPAPVPSGAELIRYVDNNYVVWLYDETEPITSGGCISARIYKARKAGLPDIVHVLVGYYQDEIRFRHVNLTPVENNEIRVETGSIIYSTKLGNDSITTAMLQNSCVTTQKLNDLSVTPSKLANGAVTVWKIGEGAVETPKLADKAVTRAKLSNDAKSPIVFIISITDSASEQTGATVRYNPLGYTWRINVSSNTCYLEIMGDGLTSDSVTAITTPNNAAVTTPIAAYSWVQNTTGGIRVHFDAWLLQAQSAYPDPSPVNIMLVGATAVLG